LGKSENGDTDRTGRIFTEFHTSPNFAANSGQKPMVKKANPLALAFQRDGFHGNSAAEFALLWL